MLELLCIDFLINTLLNTSKLIVLYSFFVRFLMSILKGTPIGVPFLLIIFCLNLKSSPEGEL